MNTNIRKRKIGLFAENGIIQYIGKPNVKVKDMIHIYVSHDGFFVLVDEKYNIIGYLDPFDLDIIKKLMNDENQGEKTVKEIIDKGELPLRTTTIDYNTQLNDVLTQLNSTNQLFYPVTKDGVFIGRISKRILRERIDELFN